MIKALFNVAIFMSVTGERPSSSGTAHDGEVSHSASKIKDHKLGLHMQQDEVVES